LFRSFYFFLFWRSSLPSHEGTNENKNFLFFKLVFF
jgi:hypothetical protein